MKGMRRRDPQKSGREAKKPKDMKKQLMGGIAKISFSFEFFDDSDASICPRLFHETYTQALMARMKMLSLWSLERFQNRYDKFVRNHPLDWTKTTRPNGFAGIADEHKAADAYQFAVEVQKHGRVHGFFIGATFQVVWLDCDHVLYIGEWPNERDHNENNAC
jgi:hypothetical protein